MELWQWTLRLPAEVSIPLTRKLTEYRQDYSQEYSPPPYQQKKEQEISREKDAASYYSSADSESTIDLLISKREKRPFPSEPWWPAVTVIQQPQPEPAPEILKPQKISPKKIDKNGFSSKFNMLCPDYDKEKMKPKKSFTDIISFRKNLSKENLRKQCPKTIQQKANKGKPKPAEISEKDSKQKESQNQKQTEKRKEPQKDTQVDVQMEDEQQVQAQQQLEMQLEEEYKQLKKIIQPEVHVKPPQEMKPQPEVVEILDEELSTPLPPANQQQLAKEVILIPDPPHHSSDIEIVEELIEDSSISQSQSDPEPVQEVPLQPTQTPPPEPISQAKPSENAKSPVKPQQNPEQKEKSDTCDLRKTSSDTEE